MRYYISKLALTKGIVELEINYKVADYEIIRFHMKRYKGTPNRYGYYSANPGEWHTNIKDALKDAESKRVIMLKQLKDRIARIEIMEFIKPQPIVDKSSEPTDLLMNQFLGVDNEAL